MSKNGAIEKAKKYADIIGLLIPEGENHNAELYRSIEKA